MTIVKLPSRRVDIDLYVCDECKRDVQVREGNDPPWPWREVRVKGWVGVFHACSDGCEYLIAQRHT